MEQASIFLVSLGCPKNLVDSEVMLGILGKAGYRLTGSPEEADIIIVNTCSFIHDSKQESIDTILELAEYKKTGKCKTLIACGCLPQRYGKVLAKGMPEIDLLIGTGEYHKIAEFLSRPDGEKLHVSKPEFIHTEKDPRLHTGPSYIGYLRISEGCNRRCSFCAIPAIRGPVRSRTVASLVEESRRLVDEGVRELCLIAQDLTEYGRDLGKSETLPELLRQLAKIDKLRWIRLHYAYPDDFSDELVEVMAETSKVLPYIDLPIQHTSDKILKGMHRKLRKKRLFELIEKLREKVPGITIRTSIIVGFPGETAADFRELCGDLTKLDLDHVGVFSYSREEGTPAAKLPAQVGAATKRKRQAELLKLLERQAHKRKKSFIGRRFEALIEGGSEETDLLIEGRLPSQAPGAIDGRLLINDIDQKIEPSRLKAGLFVRAEITEALPHDFIGKIVEIL